MTAANVVDVSEWQPTSIDWANLKANGVKAVVVRIGHGVTRDDHAADHIANATKAGLIVHAYHYYEGVDGELQYSVNNAKSLNIQPNVFYFLDMEGTIAGSWPSIFESFRKQWAGYGWNTGLYCSLSNYAKFDNATLVKQGVYRLIAAWGSSQPSNADMWQYDSKTGLGSYTSALDKDVDIAGKLIKEPDSTVVEPTDPNGNYTIKPGAFVGFDYSTTELQGGEMLVASPDGQNKIPKLSPDGQFLFNNNDGDNMWTLIKPKISTIKGAISDKSTDFNNMTSEGHYDIRFSPNTGKDGPNEGNWGLLDVKVAGRMVVQTYYGDINANVYVRNCRDGTTWTAWREIKFWS